MKSNSKILIVGHNGVLEQSLVNGLRQRGFTDVDSTSEMALEPTIQASVYEYFQEHRPEYVFLGSTRSGGIQANIDRGAEFIYHNNESQNNILYASKKFGVKKLLYFASSCIYPVSAAVPITEDSLLSGPLEKTSEPYSIAKIAGLKLCQAFKKQYGFNAIVAVPATLYGPHQDMDQGKAHVIGALTAKFMEAVREKKSKVVVWGSGSPRREFLYEDDLVEGSIFLMERYEGNEIINMGTGQDVAIKELAQVIAKESGFQGSIEFDRSKPDGVLRKLLDVTKINNLGWKARVELRKGIQTLF